MLYLILPPIIVIVTLVFLVYFFSRRFPSVEKEIGTHLGGQNPVNAYSVRIFNVVKRASLYTLERLVQWFKVMTLRFYNILHNWTQSLREKKSKASVQSEVIALKETPEETRSIARLKTEIYNRKVRPIVSQRVTQPEEKVKPSPSTMSPPVLKNQLEDILVERIAANPRDLEAYERLGEHCMEQGNLQDAKECYRQVLRLSPVHRLAKVKIRRLEKMLEQK